MINSRTCSVQKARTLFPSAISCCILLFFLLLPGCSGGDSPEDSVRTFIAEAETAVEAGNVRKIRELIADDYRDPAGRSKSELVNYVAYQVLRKRAIHLYTSVSTISFPAPQRAVVELLTAMTGSPANSRNALLDLRADIYTFNFHLRRSGDSWQVTTASWEPAMLDDLFPD